MDLNQKLHLIRQVGEEIITEEDLTALLLEKKHPIAYDGFEPSGTNIHIAQGLLRSININKMTQAGFTFKMLVADWHAWANNKMNGNLEHIQTVGKYLIEVWKACDMDTSKVEFVWANDLMQEPDYLKTVMQVSRSTTVNRILRCAQIMGRKESESLQASQIFYPCMQAADIFHLQADVTQLGMDQRKVNMLAREIGPKLGFWKPVVVSHHMLMGLGQPPAKDAPMDERVMALKMSKSKPDTAIFMTDSEDDIKRKIGKAYCPEGIIEENPILEYYKYIVFEKFPEITIERPAKFGGNLTFNSYQELEQSFAQKQLHPMDAKQGAAVYLNNMVAPVRETLEKKPAVKRLQEQIAEFEVTR